jgi:hypothetical protein
MFNHRLFPVLAPVFVGATLLAPIACERDGTDTTTVAADTAGRSGSATMPGAGTEAERTTQGTPQTGPGTPGVQGSPPPVERMGEPPMGERPMGGERMGERPMGEAPTGERPPTAMGEHGEGMDANTDQRILAAQQRYDQLDRQYETIKQRLDAKGDDAATKAKNEIEEARKEAKNKLEAARGATEANARQAVQDLDSALDRLDKKLADQPQT